jgi:hypothetical protein
VMAVSDARIYFSACYVLLLCMVVMLGYLQAFHCRESMVMFKKGCSCFVFLFFSFCLQAPVIVPLFSDSGTSNSGWSFVRKNKE